MPIYINFKGKGKSIQNILLKDAQIVYHIKVKVAVIAAVFESLQTPIWKTKKLDGKTKNRQTAFTTQPSGKVSPPTWKCQWGEINTHSHKSCVLSGSVQEEAQGKGVCLTDPRTRDPPKKKTSQQIFTRGMMGPCQNSRWNGEGCCPVQ